MTRLPLVLNQCTKFSDPSGAIDRWSFFAPVNLGKIWYKDKNKHITEFFSLKKICYM
jgi:hypothetical protein